MGINGNNIFSEETMNVKSENICKGDKLCENFLDNDRKIGFEEFRGNIASQIDEFILDYEKKDGSQYIGGNCLFKIIGIRKKCVVSAVLYFKDAKDEYMEVTMSGSFPVSGFLKESVETEIAKIKRKKGIKVEIIHP